MKHAALRALSVATVAAGFFAACGGAVVGVRPDGSSRDASRDASNSDASQCVFVDLSTYNQSCQQASDCMFAPSGEVCTGQCVCSNHLINVSERARYARATAAIQFSDCPCMELAAPRCLNDRCTLCAGPNQPAGCGDGG